MKKITVVCIIFTIDAILGAILSLCGIVISALGLHFKTSIFDFLSGVSYLAVGCIMASQISRAYRLHRGIFSYDKSIDGIANEDTARLNINTPGCIIGIFGAGLSIQTVSTAVSSIIQEIGVIQTLSAANTTTELVEKSQELLDAAAGLNGSILSLICLAIGVDIIAISCLIIVVHELIPRQKEQENKIPIV